VTDEMLTTQLQRGAVVRVRQGVYLAAASWPDDPVGRHLLRARAELVVSPEAVISRQSAALAWALPTPTARPWHVLPPSVSLPAGAGYRVRSNGSVHHVEQLPAAHLDVDDQGFRITGLARTAVDLATGLTLPERLVLLDAAARQLVGRYVASPRRRDYANPQLVAAARAELSDMAVARRRTGLLEAVARTEPCRESPIESLSAGHFHLAGLPAPLCQVPLDTPFGVLFPDFYWPEKRLIGECDGAGKYADGERVIVNEKEREQLFRDLDYRVVRWLGKEIMFRPAVVVDRVARKLGL
jgi:hypothetical protein